MMDRQEVADWIAVNLLDSDAWDKATEPKQTKAVVQAERNLAVWYPSQSFTAEFVAYQAVWELQGIDPALKYQKQGATAVGDRGEYLSFKARDKVSPEVRQVYGSPTDELRDEYAPQFGGALR